MSKRYPGGFITKNAPTVSTSSAQGVWDLEQQAAYQKAGTWPFGGPFNYIEDVFSTWLYTGNGSTQTVTNGIDLAGQGGLVWIKSRQYAYNHSLTDTARGVNQGLASNTTSAQVDYSGSGGSVTAFNSTGFSLGSRTEVNDTGTNVSWTFREQPKFFDVVTYTGNLTARTIAHNLGSVPGCIIIKRTNGVSNWAVYHRSVGNSKYLDLNQSNPESGWDYWNYTDPTSTVFSIGANSNVNASGGTYVAYIFAHNAGGFGLTGTDNVISCGSFTGNGSATGPSVNLGYEPQWILFKNASAVSSVGWILTDNMRGCEVNGTDGYLVPNLSQAETDTAYVDFTSTGFNINSTFADVNGSGNTIIYIAIRRGPMKVPTDGASVFSPVAYTATNVDNRLVNTGIVTDMTMARIRTATSTGGFYTADRLRGNPFLGTALTSAEDNTDTDSFMTPTAGYGNSFSAMNGFGVGNDSTRQLNYLTSTEIAYAFKRAPGFFDEVCYTGTGSLVTVNHNLGVAPELMIIKSRNGTRVWRVYNRNLTANAELNLNSTAAVSYSATNFNNTDPTSTVFTVNTNSAVNAATDTYVNYLFASCPGVSKVGSYTGNGSTQTINCGFTGGARFVLIKRTDSTGDWYVYDTARGMTTLTDPYLLLNSTAAESATLGSVTTVSTGFAVDASILAAVNTNAATYIFLAIA